MVNLVALSILGSLAAAAASSKGCGKELPSGGKFTWQGDPSIPEQDTRDTTFTWDLLDHMENNYCIDSERVYAAGNSNGGGFAGWQLPCNSTLNKRFAAYTQASEAIYNWGQAKDIFNSTYIWYPQYEGQDPKDSLVQHYRLNGYGHLHPNKAWGAPFDATPMMFDFFNRHKL